MHWCLIYTNFSARHFFFPVDHVSWFEDLGGRRRSLDVKLGFAGLNVINPKHCQAGHMALRIILKWRYRKRIVSQKPEYVVLR